MNEARYQALWKRFYDTVAIEGRENPRCRMTHMPKRYWENMLEVSDLIRPKKTDSERIRPCVFRICCFLRMRLI